MQQDCLHAATVSRRALEAQVLGPEPGLGPVLAAQAVPARVLALAT